MVNQISPLLNLSPSPLAGRHRNGLEGGSMNANNIKRLFAGLVAALALGALSAPAHADFVATTASAGKGVLPPSTVIPDHEYREDEADAKDGERLSLEAPEMEMALLFLLI